MGDQGGAGRGPRPRGAGICWEIGPIWVSGCYQAPTHLQLEAGPMLIKLSQWALSMVFLVGDRPLSREVSRSKW